MVLNEIKCDVKLNFDDLDDSVTEDLSIRSPMSNVSLKNDCNNPILGSASPHSMRRPRPIPKCHKSGIKSVKLFGSPKSPRVLSRLHEKSASSLKSKRVQIFRPKNASKQDGISPNINPFTPSGLYLSERRKSRGMQSEPSEDSFTATPERSSLVQENPELANVSLEEMEETLTQSRRLKTSSEHLDRYKKEFIEFEQIGKGDFGGVFKCKHKLDGCLYAIKKSAIPVHGSYKERIALNEVYAHAVLGKHPHVVRYHSAWAEEDCMIVQSEYCNGGSLTKLIQENKEKHEKFTNEELKKILLHTALGLRYIHSQKLVHLDIKPDNILISKEQITENDVETTETTYKIGDLGFVTSLVDPKVEEGDNRYLAKEVLSEDYSQLTKADIFALGMAIYEAASGESLPRNGDRWHAYRNGLFPAVEGLSPHLMELIRSMCDINPSSRPSAEDLVDQLSNRSPRNLGSFFLQQELERLQSTERQLSTNLAQAVTYLEHINPAFAANLRDALGPMKPESNNNMFNHEPCTPPKEPSPVKNHLPKILQKGPTRVHKKTSPITTRRQLSKKFSKSGLDS